MTQDSKEYLLKTIVAVLLIIVGAWGIYAYNGFIEVLAVICFLIGFIIMLALYGWRWLEVWFDAWSRR